MIFGVLDLPGNQPAFLWENLQEVFILVPTPVAMLGAGPFSFSGLLSEGPAERFCGSSDFSPTAIFYISFRLIQIQDDLSNTVLRLDIITMTHC